MNHKDINWSRVVTFILEDLYYSPKELSKQCIVTHQAVQQWKLQIIRPKPRVKKALKNILTKAGVSLKDFTDKPNKEIADEGLRELIDLYSKLSEDKKISLMEYARYQKSKCWCPII